MLTEKITTYHIYYHIDVMLNKSDNYLEGMFHDDSGRALTPNEVRKYLQECLNKGWKVHPCGDCDNFDH